MLSWLLIGGGFLSPAIAADFPQPHAYRDGLTIADYLARPVIIGKRIYWDGERLQGEGDIVYTPPDWFVNGFPTTPMDGIITSPRLDEEAIFRIIQHAEAEVGWRKLHFLALDLPDTAAPALERQSQLQALVATAKLPQLRAERWQKFADESAFQEALDTMYKNSGKGFILRHVESDYRADEDELLLALPYEVGAAIIVAHRPGKGNFSGMLGGLEVTSDEFSTFRIGTGFSDAERRDPPLPGVRIEYRYKGLTDNGKPKSPVYLGVLPPLEKKIGGWLKTTHLLWLFIGLMGSLALLDGISHRRGGARWNLKSAIVSTGLLGTFIGIWWGLYNFDTNDIVAGVPALLDGLKLSFITSIVGIFLSTVLSVAQTLSGVSD